MLITQDDIQRIGDEETLIHFLQEKLNLPIPEGATLAQIALPLPLPFLGLDAAIAEHIIDCQDFRGLPQDPLGARRPFLIRFKRETDYSEILRKVAESLYQKSTNPVHLFFICADGNFQPFAFAYFNDSESEDWQAAVLNILAWIQDNTHIHTSSEHELPIGFFSSEPSGDFDDKSDIFDEKTVTTTSDDEYDDIDSLTNERIDEEIADNNILADAGARNKTAVDKLWEIFDNKTARHRINPTSSNDLLNKLEQVGVPLKRHWNTYSAPSVQPGCSDALVLDEFKYEQLIREELKSREIIEPVICIPRRKGNHRWKPERKHMIWMASSEFKQWPWSKTYPEAEAERIFAITYPVISRHVYGYKNELKNCSPKSRGKFYWEIPKRPVPELNQEFTQPKIVYPAEGMSLYAGYDESGSLILGNWTCFIPTEDLSLLAILNSTSFDYYAKANYQAKYTHKGKIPEGWLSFKKENMKEFPVANRKEGQKAELSDLVQQILRVPNSPNVLNLEEEINMLVYDLYDLTSAEIALIEKGNNQ